ncbi:MAG: diaminopimelate epimerase [Candidatus Krumholzibacteria bacterium]
MDISFVKMHGAGNDFVVMDNRGGAIRLDAARIRAMCDRRRGVGADGVILIEGAEEADFRMRYYNSDGGEAEMCGNGARCAAFHAVRLGLGEGRGETVHVRFVTGPGLIEGHVEGCQVAISMTDATSFKKGVCLPVAEGEEIVHFIDTGVPHAVVVEKDVWALDDRAVAGRGRAIRMHSAFEPDGANVDFVTTLDDGRVAVRTYERGVEAETEACGTGAVAAAVVLAKLGKARSPVTLVTRGGETLSVSLEEAAWGASGVVLTGPTAVSFQGTMRLSRGE